MNNARRKQIRKINDQISELLEALREIQEEEEEARDSMPESLWGSERYEKAESACDCLAEAADGMEEVLEKLEEAIE